MYAIEHEMEWANRNDENCKILAKKSESTENCDVSISISAQWNSIVSDVEREICRVPKKECLWKKNI